MSRERRREMVDREHPALSTQFGVVLPCRRLVIV